MSVDYTTAEGGAKLQRLRTLIERSKIYTSILADKLLKQQSEARERGEELDRQRRLEDSKAQKQATIAAGPTRKSSRHKGPENKPEEKEEKEEHTSPTKKGKAAAVAKGKKGEKGGKMNLADYFNKKELETELTTKDALKKAQEEELEDVGVTAITKPSASARQPELVTGCVLRDYQVPPIVPSLCNEGANGCSWLDSNG
jgi:ATP-dependent DNA helicase